MSDLARSTAIDDGVRLRDAAEAQRDTLLFGYRGASAEGYGARSPQWRKVREAHVAEHPLCAACGRKDSLNVHHIKPFHVYPELELEPSNLMTLCEDGPAGMNCHLLVGHGGWWEAHVLDPAAAAAAVLGHILTRVEGPPWPEV